MSEQKPRIISFGPGLNQKMIDAGITIDSFDDWPAEIIFCETFKDLSAVLHKEPILIIAANSLIKKYGSLEEFLLMTDTLIKFNDSPNKPVIAVGICPGTTQEEIKQFQRHNLNIFPGAVYFGINEFKTAIENFLSTGRSWPKHIVNLLTESKEKFKFKDIHLTSRQQQVHDLIARRGLTNKQIAQVLKISESTVKIHVSAVMRALCVRNRTQLALTK